MKKNTRKTHLKLLPPIAAENEQLQEGQERCTKCKNVTKWIAKVNGEERLCKTCHRRSKPPEPCPLCGHLTNDLCTSPANGVTVPACRKCRYGEKEKKERVLCRVCNKHRKPIGSFENGRFICKRCVELGGDNFICPKCNKPGKIFSAEKCRDCYLAELSDRKAQKLAAEIHTPWIREAYIGCMTALRRKNAKESCIRVKSYAEFFYEIDKSGLEASAVTAAQLMGIFGAKRLRGYFLPLSYLTDNKIIPPLEKVDWVDASGNESLRVLLDKATGTWYYKVLSDYADYLRDLQNKHKMAGNDKTGMRWMNSQTIAKRVSTVSIFLSGLEGVSKPYEIAQRHVDLYFEKFPGTKKYMSLFLRYLTDSKKVAFSFDLKPTIYKFNNQYLLSEEKQNELKSAWRNPSDNNLRDAVIGLLILIYAQRPEAIVGIKLSDILYDDGKMVIDFGGRKMRVNHKLADIITRYLKVRTSPTVLQDIADNQYLFPGMQIGSHLSANTVVENISMRFNVSITELYQTALWNIALRGFRNPGYLVRELGIGLKTAMDVFYAINPKARDEANWILKNEK